MAKQGILNWKAIALASGILWGVYLFLAGILAVNNVSMLWFSPEMFSLMASIYPGLAPTLAGAFIGLIWGFFCGAFCGGIFAGLNNWLVNKL